MTSESDKQAKGFAPDAHSNKGTSVEAIPPASVNVIRDIKLPSMLIGSEEGHIELTFAPELEYIKVRISATNPNLKITCGGKVSRDCVFEFAFEKNEARKKSFEIRASTVEKESAEQIVISYTLQKKSKFDDGVAKWITFKPVPQLNDYALFNLFRWLWHELGQLTKNWYVRSAILAVIMFGGLMYFDGPRAKVGKAANSLLVWSRIKSPPPPPPPRRYTGSWPDPMQATADGRPLERDWDLTSKTWAMSDRVLHIKGEGIGFIKIPDSTAAPYDYVSTFKIRLTAHQRKVGWLIRVKDKGHYYLFELTLPSGNSTEAKLEGTVVDGQKTRALTSTNLNSISCYPLKHGDMLTITLEVVNNEFKHTISLTLAENDPNNPNVEFEGIDSTATFTDGLNSYPFGSFGFKGGADYGEMIIDDINIRTIDPAKPTPSTPS